jgi:FMN phosphatase YigB (HAD superfamily)
MRAFEALMIGDRLSNDIRPTRLLGSKTIRVAQGVRARFQSPRSSCGDPDLTGHDLTGPDLTGPDLTGNDLAEVAPALNDKFYTR